MFDHIVHLKSRMRGGNLSGDRRSNISLGKIHLSILVFSVLKQHNLQFFIDFKKAFDRVWHENLWANMRKHNINANIIRAIENLYDKAQSAALLTGSTGGWFRTTVGVRQGCLLSPTLFNIFLERIMCDELDDHESSINIEGRLITNFRFADDIVVNTEEEEEAGVLVDHLDITTTRYKMEIGPDKTKVMTNNPNGF